MGDIDLNDPSRVLQRPAAIRQAIENLLRTRKGERPFEPTLGVSFQLEGGSAKTGVSATDITKECADLLAKFEPRINVVKVDPTLGQDGVLQSVKIDFTDKEDNRADSVIVKYGPFKKGA